jgi:nucleotidyltransferase/DNA polymerase involved in DNA repair
MQEFVIERDIPGAGRMTEDEIRDVSIRSLQVLKGMGPQIQWLHSYVTDDRLYCVYLAADEESIREHARQLGVPATRIAAVRRLVDPARYA